MPARTSAQPPTRTLNGGGDSGGLLNSPRVRNKFCRMRQPSNGVFWKSTSHEPQTRTTSTKTETAAKKTPQNVKTKSLNLSVALQAGGAFSVASNNVAAQGLSTPAPPAAEQVLAFNGTTLAWNDAGDVSGAWLLGGNAGTLPGTHFLGTTGNQPLELLVNGQCALRLQPAGGSTPSIVGGDMASTVASGAAGGTIGGGEDDRHIATVDADGVALAAVQGLNEKVETGKRETETLVPRIAELERRLAALERLVQAQTK